MKLFTSANIHKSTTITQNIDEHFSLWGKGLAAALAQQQNGAWRRRETTNGKEGNPL